MQFRSHSIEDAVNHELLVNALHLAHQKHAAMHRKDEKFELHVIEDTSPLSHGANVADEKSEQKKGHADPVHSPNYHPVAEKYDAPFHVDTLKDCMIGCDCGWTGHLSEFLNEEVVRVETKKEKEGYASHSYGPAPAGY